MLDDIIKLIKSMDTQNKNTETSVKPGDNAPLILWFSGISKKDVPLVGGKNASLGEMYSNLSQKGINVPDGFATTARFYNYFLEATKTKEKLESLFKNHKPGNIKSLQKTGKAARDLILETELPKELEREVLQAYSRLCDEYGPNADVAVRSSATAEDLPEASFAGQHESYLNVKGKKDLLIYLKKCISSLFTDRAITYREEKGFDHFKIALSVGVMKMVRSDLGCSGVMFTLDTESGFKDVVLINGSWGLGETIVKGRVVPDEFVVFKPTLKQGFSPIISRILGTKKRKLIYGSGSENTKQVPVSLKDRNRFVISEEEVLTLSRWAVKIEEHYGLPQDIEWAKDGKTGKIYIVQSRPETAHSSNKNNSYKQYLLTGKGDLLLEGEAIGSKIASGRVKIITDVSKIGSFREGDILATRMTDPDWTSIMKKAKAIITEEGSRVCHAAIVSRELGIPCIVGVEKAMQTLKNGEMVTVDCSTGQKGRIFAGNIKFEIRQINPDEIPATKTKIMMNTSYPDAAFPNALLPSSGIGLAREEFVIASTIKIHPLALCHFAKLKDKQLKKTIEEITVGYKDKKEYFIENLTRGIGKMAAAFWPRPVIARFSDFKSNEYAALIGGKSFEPEESNPMLGWRGASRYYDDNFKPAFLMECEAVKRVREKYGLKNLKVMVPFCRTPGEGERVMAIIRESGLKLRIDTTPGAPQDENTVEVYVMCEIPSNVILVDRFLDIFDGMSIGSNDLTQLILGLDRDSSFVSRIGDERNAAVKEMIKNVIQECKKRGKYVGICGDAPSSFEDFAEFLVKEGIDSISLNPDVVIKTTLRIAETEKNI